jgi:hypothetical protein
MSSDKSRMDEMIEAAHRNREQKEKSYRGRALKLFPKIWSRCGREFEGTRLGELTVHHKDHDHDNNPPDGSNWELLCLYCHDNEHARDEVSQWYDNTPGRSREADEPTLTHKPFEGLSDLLNRMKKDEGGEK